MATRRSEVRVNVYDLLPPGHVSSFLWHIGNGLLHSGVVVNGKEYAYGGHDRRGVTGVYWMTPGLEPPGGTFRCGILHGYTLLTEEEIDDVVTEVSPPSHDSQIHDANSQRSRPLTSSSVLLGICFLTIATTLPHISVSA